LEPTTLYLLPLPRPARIDHWDVFVRQWLGVSPVWAFTYTGANHQRPR